MQYLRFTRKEERKPLHFIEDSFTLILSGSIQVALVIWGLTFRKWPTDTKTPKTQVPLSKNVEHHQIRMVLTTNNEGQLYRI